MEAKPIEVIMQIDFASSSGTEIVAHAERVSELVRCKDCKYYRAGEKLSQQKFCFRLKDRDGAAIGYNFAEDDFCSYGERSKE